MTPRIKRTRTLESYYYRDLTLEKQRAANTRLLSTYGITIKDYDRMFEEQKEACWICLRPPGTVRLSVDHRHVLKYKTLDRELKRLEVRGLLCFTCNVMLGKLEKCKDARYRLERITEYFKTYKIRGDL